jgi:hypothetical protein
MGGGSGYFHKDTFSSYRKKKEKLETLLKNRPKASPLKEARCHRLRGEN